MSNLPDYEKLGVFYLGKKYDLQAKQLQNDLVLFPSKNLVTHGLIVGMTGSGKTGLCFDIIEEAAIDSIPSIVIDPKGDLSNLLLTFPDLKPEDFRPWVNDEDATKAGVTIDEFAAKQAETWRKGLADWGQDGERIRRLREAADFVVYTPGSSAGVQVSVLKSFDRPPAELLEDAELLRERVGTTVASLLQLVGVDADPVKSRETVLLSNLLQHAWSSGRDLDLAGLIQEVQKPSITKVGVLDLETFFPSKQRFELAMQLNNLLASPSFAAWMQGEALDVGKFLHSSAGKPRVAVFSIAHLGDAERMFFVTMLLNQVLGWMRSQSGTNSLRALLYMDEIFGYFPPVANPPSKLPLLTLLKQARAFGLGVVLATQNPVDLDYKGLANIGSWFIGRLQTERDKARILDGLEGAASSQGGKFDRAAMEQTLAALGNRVFLLHSVHDDGQVIFQSRWAMSYLRGPLSRTQIKGLTADQKKDAPASADKTPVRAAVPTAIRVGSARPMLPAEVQQLFMPVRGKPPVDGGILYQAKLLGVAAVRFTDKKAKIDDSQDFLAVTNITDEAIKVDWDNSEELECKPDDLGTSPPQAEFAETGSAVGQVKNYSKWGKDFSDWIYANKRMTIFRSPLLEETSLAEEDERAFRIRMQLVARERRDEEVEKQQKKYDKDREKIEQKIQRLEQRKQKEASQSRSAILNAIISMISAIVAVVFGRGKGKINTTTIGKGATAARGATRSMEQMEDVKQADENLADQKQLLADLLEQQNKELDALKEKYDVAKEQLEQVAINPTKTNIAVKLVGLVWMPYFRDKTGILNPGY